MKNQQELARRGLNIQPCEDYMCDEQLSFYPQLIGVVDSNQMLKASKLLTTREEKLKYVLELRRMYGRKTTIRLQDCGVFKCKVTFIYDKGNANISDSEVENKEYVESAVSMLNEAFPTLEKSLVTIGVSQSEVITFISVTDFT